MGDWAPKNGIKTVVTLVADYGPGNDAEKFFTERFQLNGGKVLDKLRVPLRNPDFAPFLQKVRDAQARRAVRLRALGRRRGRHEAVPRARHGQGRHQADRAPAT